MAKRNKNIPKRALRSREALSRPHRFGVAPKTFVQKQLLVSRSESYSGPLPPPHVLKGYEEILPGMADRVMTLVEKQSAHRQYIESIAIKSGAQDSKWGIRFAFIISIFAIACGSLLIYFGKEIGGSVIGGGALSSLVGVFIYGSRQRRMERESKNKELQAKKK